MTNASKKRLLQDIDTFLPSARVAGKAMQSHDHFWEMQIERRQYSWKPR
jgi:hypothetical protein